MHGSGEPTSRHIPQLLPKYSLKALAMDMGISLPAKHSDGLIGRPSDALLYDIGDHDRENATQSIASEHSPLLHRHRSLGSLSQTAFARNMPHNGISVIGHFEHLEAARAQKTTLQYEFQAAKKRWKQTNKAYRKARALYERVALNPFAEQTSDRPGHDIANVRSRFNRLQTDLESQCSNIRAIKQSLQTAHTSAERSERNLWSF